MHRAGELVPIATPLSAPVTNANSRWSRRRALLYRIRQSDGRDGLGEAAPLPGYSTDSLEDCHAALAAFAVPQGPLSMASIRSAVGSIDESLPAARYAAESALLDLLAQERQTSLAALLGGTAMRAERCALIETASAMHECETALARGIDTVKLKVGSFWPEELSVIGKLRARHTEINIRLDANGAWSPSEALSHLRDLAGLDIQFVEQPVRPEDMAQLGASPVPLAADESMRSPGERAILEAQIADGSLVAVVLKPTVLGGLLECMDLCSWAKARGLACIASHSFEGPVGTAGVAELALATQGIFAAGLDLHRGLELCPKLQAPQLAANAIRSHRPGLGLSLSP